MAAPNIGKALWQTENRDVSGRPGKSIFKGLANPPADAVNAEKKANKRLADQGTTAPASVPWLETRYENRDFYRQSRPNRSAITTN